MTLSKKSNVVALLLVVAFSTEARAVDASLPRSPQTALESARETASSLERRVRALRADFASGSFERALSQLASMAAVEPAVRISPPPAPVRLGALPENLARPVDDLLGAVLSSATTVRAASRTGGERREALAARSERFAHRLLGSPAERIEPAVARRALRLLDEVARDPVLRAALRGALTVGAALDRNLPALREMSRPARDSASATQCDVLDRLPYLCVGGESANTYITDAALLIDLGGSDLYLNNAGGANPVRCGEPDPDYDPSCSTSVVLDLGGDDVYRPDQSPARTPFDHLVAGGSAMEGAGILVDVAGNDTYEANIAPRERPLDHPFLWGSATFGVGLLADLAGDDAYTVTAAPRDVITPYAHGASLDGLGALLDFGGENTYEASIAGFQHPDPLSEFLFVQAFATFGAAALYDRSGRADLSAVIDLTAGPQSGINIGNVVGQGTALAGGVALLAGEGPTSYTARTDRVARLDAVDELPQESRLSGQANTAAQAIAVLGEAVLDDLGGNDRYIATALSEHRLSFTATEECDCDGLEVTIHSNGVEGTDETMGASVGAQGIGNGVFVPDGFALLADHGGNDTYVAEARREVAVDVVNQAPGSTVRASAWPVGWGFDLFAGAGGQGLAADAPAFLLDHGGNDSYLLRADGRSDARVDGGAPSSTARALSPLSSLYGQGFTLVLPGVGALIDDGGLDRYTAESFGRATSSPNPDGAYDLQRSIAAQGSSSGLFADLDEGLSDSFVTAPEPGPGVGYRGEGPGWIDTVYGVPGFGFAPLQPPKLDSVLSLDPAMPVAGSGGIIPVRVRVNDATGPLVDREVTFALERCLCSFPLTGVDWEPFDLWSHAFTQSDGSAVGYLDVGAFADSWRSVGADPSEFTLRVAVRFAGDDRHRPTFVSAPFQLTDPDPTPTPTPSPTETVSPTPDPTPTGGGTRGSYPVTPNDPLFEAHNIFMAQQWAPKKILAPEAWQEERATGHSIRVAVLDTGVDLDHEDLQCPGKIAVPTNSDVVDNDSDPDDENGHGTHVAGIIGACTNNGVGIAGVAPDTTIVPIRVLNAAGEGNDAELIAGINRAVAAGAHVINMSLGYLPGRQIIDDLSAIDAAIEVAASSGTVIVAAAGNESAPLCDYPSLAEDIVCVGATDARDLKTAYSNFPVKPTGPALVAPGGSAAPFCDTYTENILSTIPLEFDTDGCTDVQGYTTKFGTSMAAPHVAGVAALVYDRVGGIRSAENAQAVIDALLSSVEDLGTPDYDPIFGEGRVNALAAVQSIPVEPEPEPTPTPTNDPSSTPTDDPSSTPTDDPSSTPTDDPSSTPTDDPSTDPGPTTPEAPSNLTARAASSSRIELAWVDNSASESGFAIERSRDGNTWQEIATAARNQTTHLDMGLEPDAAYSYRVRALNPAGYSPYSNTASATTMHEQSPGGDTEEAPAAPTNLNASSSSPSRMDLTWNDDSNNEDGFALERSNDGSTWQQITTAARNQTTYSDNGLSENTTYHYRVRAFNNAGHSPYSVVATAKTTSASSGGGGSGGGGGGGSSPSPSPTQSSVPPVKPLAVGTATTSIAASRALTTYNEGFELTGLVERDGNCTGPLEVSVSRRIHGTNSYEAVASTTVDGAGNWGLWAVGSRNAAYVAEVEATDTCDGDPSTPTDVLVKAKITVRIPKVCRGAIRGKVLPVYEGSEVSLQRRARGRWLEVARDSLDADSRFALKAARCGLHRLVWSEEGAANEPAAKRLRL